MTKETVAAVVERHRRPGERTLREVEPDLPGARWHYLRGRLPGRHVRAPGLPPTGVIFVDGDAIPKLVEALAIMTGRALASDVR